ncbi:hypothetical protein HK101_001891 [Irineochytrium annulatum]|nr:hypothetical protein HK101_001891 [Irineochytrium annulatum]
MFTFTNALLIALPALAAVANGQNSTNFQAQLQSAFNAIPSCIQSICVSTMKATPDNVCTQGGFSNIFTDNLGGALATCNTKAAQSCSSADVSAWADAQMNIADICATCYAQADNMSRTGTACNFGGSGSGKSGAVANVAGYSAAALSGAAVLMMVI